LQVLAEQSQAALENTMLKQTLTEYMEQFAVLKTQQNDFLQQAEQRYQKDKWLMEKTQNHILLSNKALTDSIEREIAALRDSLHQSATKAVSAGLAQNATSFDRTIANIEAKEVAMLKRLDNRHKTIEQNIRQLFDFDLLKQWVFWGGCACNVITLLVLLFWLW
jgi:K+-transporting ATPase c subunit